MLDTLAPGRIVVGLLRGTTNEYLSYDLNPAEARERTDEGMELILKAWGEPQPFGWQGRYFQYRTVSIWPRPQQPPAPVYVLGTSAEAGAFAARQPLRPGPVLREFRIDGPSDGLLSAAMRAVRVDAGTGRHHLPRQHDPGRDRRRGRRSIAPARQAGAVPDTRRIGRRSAVGRHHAQHRRGETARQCRRRAADQLLRRTGHGSSSKSASAARRWVPACSICRCRILVPAIPTP